MDELLISIKELTTQYITDDSIVHAVNGISLELKSGGSVGLVGESGAGKNDDGLFHHGPVAKADREDNQREHPVPRKRPNQNP